MKRMLVPTSGPSTSCAFSSRFPSATTSGGTSSLTSVRRMSSNFGVTSTNSADGRMSAAPASRYPRALEGSPMTSLESGCTTFGLRKQGSAPFQRAEPSSDKEQPQSENRAIVATWRKSFAVGRRNAHPRMIQRSADYARNMECCALGPGATICLKRRPQ